MALSVVLFEVSSRVYVNRVDVVAMIQRTLSVTPLFETTRSGQSRQRHDQLRVRDAMSLVERP
jgi:hypothetical protein